MRVYCKGWRRETRRHPPTFQLDICNTFSFTSSMETIIERTLVEWDDNKNLINIKMHGISFETAALVFADEERIDILINCIALTKIVM